MKKMIMAALLLLALMGCGNEPAQEEQEATEASAEQATLDVPDPISAAFAAQFPAATDVKWEMEDATVYEAEFTENGVKRSASYAADGTWQETETTIKAEALPDAVQKAISAGFAGYTLKEAEELSTPSGMMYEVELEQGKSTQEVVFSADGAQVRSKAEEAEEGGEKEE
ncbi:MAG: PepSY-like domain-containing protein [Flavobacteriales bacterium]